MEPNTLPPWIDARTLKAVGEIPYGDFNRPEVWAIHNAIHETVMTADDGDAAMIALTDLLKQLGGTHPEVLAGCISELLAVLSLKLSDED